MIPPRAGLVIVTDGITEAASPSGEQFGTWRLQILLETAARDSAAQLIKVIMKAASDFRGSFPPQDDMTVLALIRRPETAGGQS